MSPLGRRLGALEQAQSSTTPRWHCLTRYEGESEADAIAGYEANNGPIGEGSIVMRVIINKPGTRAAAGVQAN